MIKNIVFDMGNVLLDFNAEMYLDAFCVSAGEKDVFRKELFGGPEWLMGDRGDIRDSERFSLVSPRVPSKYHRELKAICDGWYTVRREVKGARDFAMEVKKQGFRVYVLSNASDAFYKFFPKFMPLGFWDGIMVSYEERLIKPDRAIYLRFLEKFGLTAGECFFIDDRPENIGGAMEAGMNGMVFEGDYDAVRERLRALQS